MAFSPHCSVKLGVDLRKFQREVQDTSFPTTLSGVMLMFPIHQHSSWHMMLHHVSRVRLFVTPWTVTCQASLSLGFSRQEY